MAMQRPHAKALCMSAPLQAMQACKKARQEGSREEEEPGEQEARTCLLYWIGWTPPHRLPLPSTACRHAGV